MQSIVSLKIAVHPTNHRSEGYPLCVLIVFRRKFTAVTLDVLPVREKSDLLQDKDSGTAVISRYATYYKHRTRTNDYLNTVLSECLKAIKNISHSTLSCFTLTDFAKTVKTVVDSYTIKEEKGFEKDFYLCFEKYITDKLAVKALNTARTAAVTMRCLRQFKPVLRPFEVNYRFIKGFEIWYLGQGKTLNGLASHLRYLRTVYNYALNNEFISEDSYPFKRYRIRTTKTSKRALNSDLLNVLKRYVPQCNTEALALDIFFFSFENAGINFKDIALLTTDNIEGGRLRYSRSKTGDKFNLPLSAASQRILDKYSGGKYLLPVVLQEHLSGNDLSKHVQNRCCQMNKYLRRIGKQCSMPVPLTTYVARHSFATLAKRKNVPITAISELLGHEDIKTTQVYLASLESEALDGYMAEITAI